MLNAIIVYRYLLVVINTLHSLVKKESLPKQRATVKVIIQSYCESVWPDTEWGTTKSVPVLITQLSKISQTRRDVLLLALRMNGVLIPSLNE
jgi:hypothetical protein